MARWDVYKTKVKDSPLVVNIQAEKYGDADTRIVIPLVSAKNIPSSDITPSIQFDGGSYIVMTTEMLSLPKNVLGQQLGSLQGQADIIQRCIDLLFDGH